MQILVTGGMGFIGSHLVRLIMETMPQAKVVNLDVLSYAANQRNLEYVKHVFSQRYEFVHGDICDAPLVAGLLRDSHLVFNLAAETHVDRSLADASHFVRTNVSGVNSLLQAARKVWPANENRRFVQVSTDEVYGALTLEDKNIFTEQSPLMPRSPYSASKAGGELMAMSFYHSFGLPVMVTRASNNYGPHQFPEKFIPLMINRAMHSQEMPVYGDGLYVRDWMHVEDHCRALLAVAMNGQAGQVYNIGGNNQASNLQVLDMIIDSLSALLDVEASEFKALIRHVEDRPGHDRRYAIDSSKVEKELGISPQIDFAAGLYETVKWYFDNMEWWDDSNQESQLWLRR